MNRKCEFLLQQVEFLSSVALFAGVDKKFTYPTDELTRLWKLLLLNQFHDVLPGSSITLVNMSHVTTKPVFGVSDQVRHKQSCTATDDC